MPQDRYPIIGFSPGNSNVYIAVMHSGVTLAAIVGRYVTHEITKDDLIDELAPYRPNRCEGLALPIEMQERSRVRPITPRKSYSLQPLAFLVPRQIICLYYCC